MTGLLTSQPSSLSDEMADGIARNHRRKSRATSAKTTDASPLLQHERGLASRPSSRVRLMQSYQVRDPGGLPRGDEQLLGVDQARAAKFNSNQASLKITVFLNDIIRLQQHKKL